MAIEFYKEYGPLGYLANYSLHGFTKNGIYYKTVEHYYQSEKFENLKIKEKVINAETPKIASNIGRDRNNIRVANFKKIKNKVMYDGILEKFRQNRDIAYKLIETRNEPIAEATIDEYYWGIGKDKSGENHIGHILEEVRQRIKEEILEEIIKKSKEYEEVYIIGHQNPDVDSIFSSYLLSNILKSLGVNAKFASLNNNYEYKKNDRKLIEDYLNELPITIDVDNKFILVDHNSLEGISQSNVIGAIDHHIITGEVYNTIEIEYASTGLLIYDLFKDQYNFNEYEKILIALTVLSDTEYLCSSRYSIEDKKLFDSLNLDIDIKMLQKKYFQINNFNLSKEENLKIDYKEYSIDNFLIKRSIISSYKKEYDLYYKDYINFISEDIKRLLVWCDYESKKTYVYFNKNFLEYNYILTSTNVILKRLKEEKIL